MAAIQFRTVEEFAEVLQGMKASKRGCSLLIGAGTSLTAGIPTAAGFVDIIRNRHKLAYARATEKTYPKCMAELLLTQRRNLIAEHVDRAKINWAHLCIALLMQSGFIDRVLTTNFDLLVVRACALLGVFPAIYDFATSQLLKNADIPDQAVFYLHGQRTGFVLMNTQEDMAAHSKLLGPVFDSASNGRSWLVVGYSGENDPVFEHLSRQPHFDNGLFWVGYGDREPQSHVRERLLTCDKDAFFIRGHDADSFFISLARTLEVFPPDIVARPFTYVRRTLDQITPFIHPGQTLEADVLRTPGNWIRKAIEQFEAPSWDLITRGRQISADVSDQEVIANVAQYLSMKGDYERVLTFENEFNTSRSPELGELVSNAYVLLANQLLDVAKLRPRSDALDLLERAERMYESALSIKPGRHEALHNWANLLLDRAKMSSGVEAEQGFTAAEEKYLAAWQSKPDQPDILINWGNLLLDKAKASMGRQAEGLFSQAEAKYREALRIDVNLPSVRHSLGNLLLDKAKTLSGDKSRTLFDAAEAEYKTAIALDPEMAEAFYQWGNVCLDRAKRLTGAPAEEQFKLGIQKFRDALKLRPDMHQALNNWGSLLGDYAKSKVGEAAERLFESANERYRQATAMKPDFYEAWINWGNLMLDWRKRTDGSPAEARFTDAAAKYSEAHRLQPDMPEPLDNWGNLLLDHAKSKTDAEADPLFEAAFERYEAAHRRNPAMYQVLNNWGNALSDQGRRKSGDERSRLFADAEQKYLAALKLSGHAVDVVDNYCNLLVDRGMKRGAAMKFIETS